MPQVQLPSLTEMNQGNAAFSTANPGYAFDDNKGIDLLFRAATQTASYNWAKHQEIEQRKADVFKNIRDLSAVEVMPEDRKVLDEEAKSALKLLLDPSIFSGGNEAGRQEYEAKFNDLARKTYTSKQDKLHRDIDRKIMAENPEYQNPPNQIYVDEEFGKMPLGSRTYNGIIPTPTVDYTIIRKAAQPGGIRKLEDKFEIGDYTTENGQQVFKPNANGKWLATTTGATESVPEVITQNFKDLVGTPQFRKVIKPDLDYQYKWVLTPEERKKYTKADGTVDYELMLKPQIDLAIAESVATPGTTKYDDNPFVLQAQKDAAAKERARIHAANSPNNETPVTRNIYEGLKTHILDPTKPSILVGDKNNQKVIGKPLNQLSSEQAQAVLEVARRYNKDYGVADVFVSVKDGELVIVDKKKANIPKEGTKMATKDLANYEIPKEAILPPLTKQDIDLISNQTLGNPSQKEVIEQNKKLKKENQRLVVSGAEF